MLKCRGEVGIAVAMAQSATGSPKDAVATQREALGLLTKEQEGYRGEMEGRLREYERAAGAIDGGGG